MPKMTIFAVRVYKGGPYTAIVHHAYYMHHGSHRTNPAQDGEFGEAVYAYTDVARALRSLDYAVAEDRRACLGLVQGFRHGKSNQKGRISLDSRTCRLIAFFAPFETSIEVPTVMAAEDKLAMKLNPFNLGFPLKVIGH